MKLLKSRYVVLFLIAGFFFGSLAVALHHHDVSVLKQCSICKLKGSASDSCSKASFDHGLASIKIETSQDPLIAQFFPELTDPDLIDDSTRISPFSKKPPPIFV